MSLSLADMKNVVSMVDNQVDSVAAAAELLGTDRAYVYRLIQRVNDTIGRDAPPWRDGARLVIPAEIHRLAMRMRNLAAAFDEATRFPRIAAGSTIAILVHEVLHELGWEHSAYQILRSTGAVQAVCDKEVDIALLHESSLEHGKGGQELPAELAMVKLLEWRAVMVEPPHPPERQETETRWLLSWPPATHAARLNARALGAAWEQSKANPGPHLGSYVAALEAIRIGLPFKTVIPDIYLMPADWQNLKVTDLSSMVKEWLVGLYRGCDRQRLQSLLSPHEWEKIGIRRRGVNLKII